MRSAIPTAERTLDPGEQPGSFFDEGASGRAAEVGGEVVYPRNLPTTLQRRELAQETGLDYVEAVKGKECAALITAALRLPAAASR